LLASHNSFAYMPWAAIQTHSWLKALQPLGT